MVFQWGCLQRKVNQRGAVRDFRRLSAHGECAVKSPGRGVAGVEAPGTYRRFPKVRINVVYLYSALPCLKRFTVTVPSIHSHTALLL